MVRVVQLRAGTDPNTHGIAYTMRGLLESAILLDNEPYMGAVARTSDALIGRFEDLGGKLPRHVRFDLETDRAI